MVLLKWLYDESPLKHLDLSPVLTGIIAAELKRLDGEQVQAPQPVSRNHPLALRLQ